MRVAGGDNHLTRLQIALLAQHVGQQGQARYIVGQPQKAVARTDVELRRQPPVRDVELIQKVTRGQRHLAILSILLRTL